MCEWFSNELHKNNRFTEDCVLFSDKALFYVNGEVNRQNVRYWSQNDPHWGAHSKKQGAQRIMVWCGLWKAHVLGPFFFDDHVTGETYLTMLRDQLMPQLERLCKGFPQWFQHDGSSAHYAKMVRDWLNKNFSKRIERCGLVEWSPLSPDLSPLDFFFWGMLKEKVYSMKITDMNHLRERITNECAQIDGNVELLHRVHVNLTERIKLCITNGGNHIGDVIY